MQSSPNQTSRIGLAILVIALASSAAAAGAMAASLDGAVAPLLSLSGHAWMGLAIWAIVKRRLTP